MFLWGFDQEAKAYGPEVFVSNKTPFGWFTNNTLLLEAPPTNPPGDPQTSIVDIERVYISATATESLADAQRRVYVALAGESLADAEARVLAKTSSQSITDAQRIAYAATNVESVTDAKKRTMT
jgi:hypothetical protein